MRRLSNKFRKSKRMTYSNRKPLCATLLRNFDRNRSPSSKKLEIIDFTYPFLFSSVCDNCPASSFYCYYYCCCLNIQTFTIIFYSLNFIAVHAFVYGILHMMNEVCSCIVIGSPNRQIDTSKGIIVPIITYNSSIEEVEE